MECITRLQSLGITRDHAIALRRIAMTLDRWHELECGSDHGSVERDEATGKTYWRNAMTGHRFPTADRETGATKRLARIMKEYPGLLSYVQGDSRGHSLYILRASDVPAHEDISHRSIRAASRFTSETGDHQ